VTRNLWIRSTDAKDLVDTFLLATVTTILVVRLFLVIAGYPQLGGEGLHIAHLLWGGLLMLVAGGLTLTLLTRASRWLAAILSGVGFGLFIDEVGKFVTADNDYFFRPAYSIMYVVLIAIWLLTRRLFGAERLTARESTANALDYVKESGIRNLSQAELRRALQLLEQADQADPLVPEVRSLLEHVAAVPTRPPGRLARLAGRARDWYFGTVVTQRWFFGVLVTIFIILTGLNAAHIVEIVVNAIQAATARNASFDSVDDAVNGGPRFGFSGWGVLVSSSVVIVLNVLGIARLLQGSRLSAYRWFERGLLISILFVQVFNFADLQLIAFALLAFDLLVLVTIRVLIAAEEGQALADTVRLPGILEPETIRA
jgi:hypothetical protein